MSEMMKKAIRAAKPAARKVAIGVARATVGKMPPPAGRLTGLPAREGGTPVRDIRFRPWREDSSMSSTESDRALKGRPLMKQLFRAGAQGPAPTLADPLR